MEKSPKSSPSRKGSYYHVIPIKDHHEDDDDEAIRHRNNGDDEDTEEQTIYKDHEETESLVGNSSTGTSSPRHHNHLSRASSVASSVEDAAVLGAGESLSSSAIVTMMLPNDKKKNGEKIDQEPNNHDDPDDDEDDEFNLRRYHNFARSTFPPRRTTDQPLTTIPGTSGFWIVRHWNELRQAAHQRRAARLLSMTNPESTISKASVCFLSNCCDATDVGIVVAAVSIFLWITIGVVLQVTSATYWVIGCFLLVLRFTGRRLMAMTLFRRRRLSDDPSTMARFRHSSHGRLPPPII